MSETRNALDTIGPPDPEPGSVGAVVADELARMEGTLNTRLWDAITAAADDGPEGLAWLLRRLHIASEALKESYGAVESILADVLPGGFLTIEGLGSFERKEGAKRTKWDRDAATRDVLGMVLQERQVDRESGELSQWSEEQTAAIVRTAEALGVAFRFEPRSGNVKANTGLRAFGLHPDDYCEVEAGRNRVAVTWAELKAEKD